MKKYFVLLMFLLILKGYLYCQGKIVVHKVKSKAINSMFQDNNGHYWFYSNNRLLVGSLVEYDGGNFTVHRKVDGVRMNLILTMIEKDGEVYIPTFS